MVEPRTWDEALDHVLAEMREIMVSRQAKYGPDNITDQGLYGVITRADADKLARVMNSLNGKVVNGRVILDPIVDAEAKDTFEDGLLDAANYLGPIALMVHRGWWTLPRAPIQTGAFIGGPDFFGVTREEWDRTCPQCGSPCQKSRGCTCPAECLLTDLPAD